MPHRDNAPPEPVPTCLNLKVNQPVSVKLEILPAPCLAATRPAYVEICVPGAGEYNVILAPCKPTTQHNSDESRDQTPEPHDGSATIASPPLDSVSEAHYPRSNTSISNQLIDHHNMASSGCYSSRRPSAPSIVVTTSATPTPPIDANLVDGQLEPQSRLRRKRDREESNGIGGGEGEKGGACKKTRLSVPDSQEGNPSI